MKDQKIYKTKKHFNYHTGYFDNRVQSSKTLMPDKIVITTKNK